MGGCERVEEADKMVEAAIATSMVLLNQKHNNNNVIDCIYQENSIYYMPNNDGNGDYLGHVRVYKYTPIRDCSVLLKLYNSCTDIMIATLVNNTHIINPPPSCYANIEAVVGTMCYF
jgi:hypothetical protein